MPSGVEAAQDVQQIETGTNELLCSLRDRVATITFNRPEARNSLSDHLTPALRRMVRQMGEDPAVGAILLTGARERRSAPAATSREWGERFRAGTDL